MEDINWREEPLRGGIVDLFARIGCVARGFAEGGGFRVAGLIDTSPR